MTWQYDNASAVATFPNCYELQKMMNYLTSENDQGNQDEHI